MFPHKPVFAILLFLQPRLWSRAWPSCPSPNLALTNAWGDSPWKCLSWFKIEWPCFCKCLEFGMINGPQGVSGTKWKQKTDAPELAVDKAMFRSINSLPCLPDPSYASSKWSHAYKMCFCVEPRDSPARGRLLVLWPDAGMRQQSRNAVMRLTRFDATLPAWLHSMDGDTRAPVRV